MKRIKLPPSPANSAEALENGTANEAVPGHSQGQGHNRQPQLHNKEKRNPFTGLEMNPMKIDLVLEILFSFCPVSTLKKCRLVSKQWKKVSLRAWRQKAVLHPRKDAKGLPNIQRYLKLFQSNSKKDEALQLRNYPFKSFRIQSNLTEYLKESAKPLSNNARRILLRYYEGTFKVFKEFLSKYQNLDVLEVKNCELKRIVELPIQSSNAKRLKVSRNGRAYNSAIRDWKGLLECFQKLESFSIDYRTGEDCMTDIREALHAIRCIRTEGGGDVLPLRILEVVQVPMNQERCAGLSNRFQNDVDGIVKSIIHSQFPLKSLTFHLIWDVIDVIGQCHPLLRILNAYKDTLQYLKTSTVFSLWDCDMVLLRCQLQKKPNPEKIRMEALNEVHLCNGLLGLSIFADLELPNLKKLVVDNGEFPTLRGMNRLSGVQLPFPDTTVYGRLETLEFLDNRKIPGLQTIRAFAKMMPNLVNLTIPLDMQTFEVVCENFRGLKTLNVLAAQCHYDELDDESLTGFSIGKDRQGPRRPNITDLVHLTNIKIACETEWQGNAPFTDHAVVHGLLQLPKLYSLNISFKEISDRNMEKLLSHIRGHVDIHVTGGARPESYCDIDD